MKLLLLYPQPVKKPKSRLSRRGVQLESIADAVRSLFAMSTSAAMQVTEFGYERDSSDNALDARRNRESLTKAFDSSDLVIDISQAPDVNIASSDFAGPVIHLSAAFPGSFACNDISIKGRGRLLQGDIVSCIEKSREPYLDLLPSTHELDADMHYAAFSALPTRIGDAFYRNEREHAIVQLSYPEHLSSDETVNKDIEALAKALHTVEKLRSLTFVCDSLQDVPQIQQVADALKQSLGIKPAIWGLRKGEFHDMFSIVAKADVALFGGNALYADAILHRIPVFTWRCEQPGADGIAEVYKQYSEDKDRAAMLNRQRAQLDRLFEALYFDATVPNHRTCFHKVLADVINQAVHQANYELPKAHESQPSWLIQPAKLTDTQATGDKMSRSVWRDRQSLLRFKQTANKPIHPNVEASDTRVFTQIK